MKLIVVHGSDGNTWAVADTPENRESLFDAAWRHGVCTTLDCGEDELPTGRRFGGVCEEIDTDRLSEWPASNPFHRAASPSTPVTQAGLQITLAELLVLVDALEASLHYKDLLEAYKFDAATRDRVLAALTQRMHATAVPVKNEEPARKAFDGLYPVGDE